MANEICPVCEKEVHPSYREVINGVVLHAGICREKFRANESMYHEVIAKLETHNENIANEKKEIEKEVKKKIVEQTRETEERSVYIKGSVKVSSFDMPFLDMIGFMVKWAIASIPAFIILFIIGLIFFGIFGALFF